MEPLALDDILDLEAYESIRPAYRARVLAHKEERRLSVGDRITLLFEDRETVRYQVHEMARVERIRESERVQHELDVYNELVPGERELSATLFIEIPDMKQIRSELDRLLGIDESVSLLLGPPGEETRVAARFDRSQLEEDRISAVHYVRFPFEADQLERFAAGEPARILVDHAHYEAAAEISGRMRESLLRDLRGEPARLLDPALRRRAGGGDAVLLETERVRVRRPARTRHAEHVVVEPRSPLPSLVEADAALLAELLGAVQRFAADIRQRHGACRVQSDVRAGAGARLRFELIAPQS